MYISTYTRELLKKSVHILEDYFFLKKKEKKKEIYVHVYAKGTGKC